MHISAIDRLRVLMPDQVRFLAALAILNKTALSQEIESLKKTVPLTDLHELCVSAARMSRIPPFVDHVRYLVQVQAQALPRVSRMRFSPGDGPQARLTVQGHRNAQGEISFQETPFCAKAEDIKAWREKKGTNPEAQKDRWGPRPIRANPYDQAKLQPHKRRYGNA